MAPWQEGFGAGASGRGPCSLCWHPHLRGTGVALVQEKIRKNANPNSCLALTGQQSKRVESKGKTGFDESTTVEYICGMKVKTSVTLSEDLVEAMDKQSGRYKNRSDFIEAAVRTFIAQRILEEQNRKDLTIINQQADRLNEEAADVLAYQAPL